MLSLFPGTLDIFYNRVNKIDGGTAVTDSYVIPATDFIVHLHHSVSTSSVVTIPGYISTSSNPPTLSDRFYIDYENNEIVFNSSSANSTVGITILCDGDYIVADDINQLQDAISQIQSTLGTDPQYTFATVKAYLSSIYGSFDASSGHKHTGTAQDGPLLTIDSISGLTIRNRHVATDAGITTGKLDYYDPNIVSTSGTSTLEDTLDWLYTQINEVSTSAGVQSINVDGDEITGDLTFIGLGSVGITHVGDAVYFSTSADVTGIKADGYDYINGNITIIGAGSSNISQSGKIITVSTSATHQHYCDRVIISAAQAASGIVSTSSVYTVGDDSMQVEWQSSFCWLGDEYTETNDRSITFDIGGLGSISEGDKIVLRWWK